MKEEFSNKEMEGCTFTPKINTDYHRGDGEEIEDRNGRIERMYKMGMQIISSRKDKPKEDIEVELYGKECTFKPEIKKEFNISHDDKYNNDIYNDKSYELLYNRLKNGRLERMIKDSVHERGEFPPEIEEYCNIIIKLIFLL